MSLTLHIASEFSRTPGPRTRDEGDFSGELFLETHLKPRFEEALKKGTTLMIILDGAEGYATSFLEASFGGLARIYPSETILKTIKFISTEEPFLIEEIDGYVKNARNDLV